MSLVSLRRSLSVTHLTLLLVTLAGYSSAQQFPNSSFNADYPGLSSACATAVNPSLECDDVLGSMSIDLVYLDDDDLEALCTTTCEQSLLDAQASIQSACAADTDVIVDLGVAYPASYVLDHFIYAYRSTCRTDSSTGEYCQTLFQEWMNETGLSRDEECSDCMLGVSQIQLGSPFGYSEEYAQNFSSTTESCGKTGYSYSTTSTYGLNNTATPTPTGSPTSPDCPDTYTIAGGDSCTSISLSHNVSTFSLLYWNGLTSGCRDFPSEGTTICLPSPCDIYTVEENNTCFGIIANYAPDYSIRQLQSWNMNINALCTNLDQMVGTQICISPPEDIADSMPTNTNPVVTSFTSPVPAPTNVADGTNPRCGRWYTVQEGDQCGLVSAQFGIPLDDFYFLNPEINANCTNLLLGEAYCVAPVGSISTYTNYTGGSPVTGDCTGAFGPSSCYNDMATLTDVPFIEPNATWGPIATGSSSSWVSPTPEPTAPGTISGCKLYAEYEEASNADIEASINTCRSVASFYGSTVELLLEWNPSLSEDDCNLEKGSSYCVRKDEIVSTTTSEAGSSPTGVTPPGPTQDGIVENCNKYVMQEDGVYCADMAADAGISLDQLYEWNPALGGDCSGLWPDYAYCVGVSDDDDGGSTPTTTATQSPSPTGVAPPGPTQSGIPDNCDEYVMQEDGVYCADMAQNAGISLDELYDWNPALGRDCSGLWPDYAYCVGVSGD
ncbi:hypothetical protein BDY21DRAFT_419731 [Lineolata rhizophorae]|uniref:LysM domain-containing protein n=1 Tax=Lineolata rhizophorae TaxID=578093 RepID=A0A6A6P7W9_9PEZI|nr:hypothetical protein BDY21DRAFT_419731 [Lineolata rhizophorae]